MFEASAKKLHSWGRYSMAGLLLGAALSSYGPQAAAQESEEKGIVWTEHFDGSSSVDGKIFSLTSTAGYNFNKYFGIDAGVPMYIVWAPQNSLVPANSHFIYVIGGQVNHSDTPGGTNTVYMASVDPATGNVGVWKTLSSTLPDSLVGPTVTIYNGFIYVVGGLTPNQTPTTDVSSAAVNSDGTLGSWTKSTNSYTMAVSFATAFGFGGNLYVLNGDPNGSSDPNQQTTVGLPDARFATANNGVVSTWALTNTTGKKRKNQNTWVAFGQVIDGEGIYDGTPGSQELERSSINADGTLASWNGMTGVNAPNANVYNAASFVSPLLSSANSPRFLLLGGEAFSATPGILSNKVYVNNAP